MRRMHSKKKRKSVAMKMALLQESRHQAAERRRQEKEIEAIEDVIELTEERRGEMTATQTLLRKLQAKLEKTPFKSVVCEVRNLIIQLERPLESWKLTWSVQWEFNQLFRCLDLIN
jgi:hypothetical protein